METDGKGAPCWKIQCTGLEAEMSWVCSKDRSRLIGVENLLINLLAICISSFSFVYYVIFLSSPLQTLIWKTCLHNECISYQILLILSSV